MSFTSAPSPPEVRRRVGLAQCSYFSLAGCVKRGDLWFLLTTTCVCCYRPAQRGAILRVATGHGPAALIFADWRFHRGNGGMTQDGTSSYYGDERPPASCRVLSALRFKTAARRMTYDWREFERMLVYSVEHNLQKTHGFSLRLRVCHARLP